MRYNLNINKVRASLSLLLIGMLLTACSDDSDRVDGETDVLQLVAFSRGMTDLEPVAATRAIPDGYHEYLGPSSIGVYTTSADEAPSSIRTFSYATDQWKSLVNVKNHEKYYIYGYMPASSDVHCVISKRDGMDYSQGAVLTFPELPPVLGEDFCVVTGVQQLNAKTDPVSLTPRVFAFTGKQTGSNFACLMLDHLYSCVKFRFLVDSDSDYDKLRTIKLKKVELKTTQEVSYPLTVTMKAGEDYEVAWDPATPRSNDYMPLHVSEDGEILSATTPKEVEGYFAPKSDVAGNLVLQCTYDVYDKNVTTEHPDGNLVRPHCVAVNKLPAVVAGVNQRTVLTLKVTPTYLYVLSEPDLDNPTITIGN